VGSRLDSDSSHITLLSEFSLLSVKWTFTSAGVHRMGQSNSMYGQIPCKINGWKDPGGVLRMWISTITVLQVLLDWWLQPQPMSRHTGGQIFHILKTTWNMSLFRNPKGTGSLQCLPPYIYFLSWGGTDVGIA
jgi:hypothetical protein